MIALLIYAVCNIGLAYIVGRSEISFPIRWWLTNSGGTPGTWLVSMLECPVCFGTWAGVVWGAWLNPLGLVEGPRTIVAHIVVTAVFTAGSNLLLARLSGMTVPGIEPASLPPPPPLEHP